MALIGTIRKNFWFVLIVLGLALVAFLFMDIFAGQGGGSAATGPALGKVGGTTINYNDFRRAESSLYRGSSANQYSVQNTLWNFFVEKAIIDDEADKLGIGVSRDELRDLEFGANLHPMVQNTFRNPQTGQVDLAQLNQIKDAIDNDEFTNQEFRAYWAEQEKQIIKDQKQSKLNAMVSKAMFTPTWMVNKINTQNTANATFDYVKVPFDYVSDADVEVSDADLSAYLKSNSAKYTNDKETRRGEYFVFDVIATADDSLANRDQINGLIKEFKITQNDSIFAANNNGNYVNYFAKQEELPANIKDIVGDLNAGDVYGPYIDQGFYTAFKLVDKQVVPDSVKARHILRQVAPGDLTSLETAKTLADSILTEIKAGRASFDAMASQFSQDPGSSSKGGDLGYLTQGSLLPAMNQLCFFGKEGAYEIVQTQAGVHIMHVQDQKYLNRDAKYKTAIVRVPITPSQDTQDAIYAEVTELVSKNKSIESFKTALEGKDMTSQLSAFVDQNAFNVGTLGGDKSSRDIVKWMFDSDSDVGEISAEVFSYSDPNFYYDNKYVVAGLNAVNPKGLQTVEAARDQIEFLVKNQKKGEKIIGQISGSDLSAIASQFGQQVQNIPSANINAKNITGLGNEPKVLAAALNGALNATSSPIIGNSGVYLVSPTSRTEGTAAANVPSLRASSNQSDRVRVTTGLINALKKNTKVEDSRLSLDF